MKADILRADDLTEDLARHWSAFQAAQDDLASPFFSVEFCQIVGEARADTRIALLHEGGAPRGFFPYHLKRGGCAAPLAGQISDYHGVIGDSGEMDGTNLLRGTGLSAYDFNHVPRSQQLFDRASFRHTESPLIDMLPEGFDAWRAARRAHTKSIQTVERRARKIARELGDLEYQPNDRSHEAWEMLLKWKRESLAQQGTHLILDRPWVRAVAERLRDTDNPAFGGMLSSLRAGGRLVAVHFGMRSRKAWHWWFPTYEEAVGGYSPGLVLLLECVRHGAEAGFRELDLGRGEQRYKREFATTARHLCEGSIERPLVPAGAARRLRKTVHSITDRTLPDRYVDLGRRAFNRLLGAGTL